MEPQSDPQRGPGPQVVLPTVEVPDVRVLNQQDIAERATSWPALIDAAGSSLMALAEGTGDAPLRASLPLSAGQLLTMPGRLPGSRYAVVKVLTVVPSNAERSLPTIQGTVLAFDADTGEAIAQLDGPTLTAVRTAAISAAAVRALAPQGMRALALIGAGAQAPWQVRAIRSVVPLQEIRIWAPGIRNREHLASELAREFSVEVRAVETLDGALSGADIICCSTTAQQPFLEAEFLTARPAMIVAIGAYRPDMGEVAPSVFREAGRVYVDDMAAVLHEGGDVIGAIRSGVITENDVVPVGTLIADPRGPEVGLTIFKSVGNALEDVAVTGALLEM